MPWTVVSAARSRARRLGAAAGLALAVAVVLTALAYAVRLGLPALVAGDDAVTEAATAVTRGHDGLRRFWLAWAWLSLPGHGYLVGGGCALALGLRGGWRGRAIWAFTTMMLAWGVGSALKRIVQRPRPDIADPITLSAGYSFPSGHASNAAALALGLLILFWPLLGRTWPRVLATGLGAAYVLLTAADRVFLGVHYLTDVVAGVVLGAGVVVASYAGFRGWPDPPASDLTP